MRHEKVGLALAVAIAKVAVDAPAGTVTVAGIETNAGLPLIKVTTQPPAGAGPPKVNVPVALFPAARVDGVMETL